VSLSVPPPPRPRQRRKDARPQELLDAAVSLFTAQGLSGTRAEDVARLAGVSKGTLYLYYPSKSDLFKAAVRHHLVEFIVEGGELLDGFDGPTADLLHQLASEWWTRIGSSQAAGLVLMIMNEARSFPDLVQFYLQEVVAASHALLCRVIQRGIDRGEFRPLDAGSVAYALFAPAQFLLLQRHLNHDGPDGLMPLEPSQFLHTQIELLLRGLETSPKHPHTS